MRTHGVLSAILLAAVILLASLSLAHAQQAACAPRENIVSHLAQKYGETRRGVGLMGSGVLEIFVGANGSFTVLLTRPDGTSCAVAAGEAWLEEAPRPLGPPA